MLERYARDSRTTGYPLFNLTETPPEWRHFEEAFEWLRTHTRPGDVVGAAFDTMTFLYTDRPSIRPFELKPLAIYYGAPGPQLGTVAEFDDALARHGVRYMLLTPFPAYEIPFFELVYAASDEKPSMLSPAWQSPEDGRFVIFEVTPKTAAR
jgi:hypothetical protein